MILLVGLYQDADPGRRAEFLECLRRNVDNDRLDAIYVFLEDRSDPEGLAAAYPLLASAKVHMVRHGKRLTYRDLFSFANQHLMGHRVIIANADIFFDHTLARLDGYDLLGKLLCLSRWDVQPDGSTSFFNHSASQDVWIFQAPIRAFYCDFSLGVLGCDNRLAWEAEHAGLILSNPGRSLRANHLHLSQIRRYEARQRLVGPTTAIPAKFLDAPWLWFLVPCMGRLDDLHQTIETLLAQPRSSYVLVDYASPDGAGQWVQERYPNIIVVKVGERSRFNGAEARNHGAAAADEDGILCFLDADMMAGPGFSDYVLSGYQKGSFLVPDQQGHGFDNVLICSKADFDRVNGFDQAFLDWGEECADLKSALRRSGVVENHFPATYLTHCGQHAEMLRSFGAIQDREISRAVHSAYQRAKAAILNETGGNSVSRAALREISRAITRRHLNEQKLTLDLPCASVAFRENMGYTISRLEAGASSHNNHLRPFKTIPEPLAGRPYTQVVAFSVSPVEVEFLSPGKIYVLVGNDWEGSYPATAWLHETGFKEWLPIVETQLGTAFEVWSLIGEAGEKYTLPTQVMLVAEHLVRK